MLAVNLTVLAIIGFVATWRTLFALRWGTRRQRALAAGCLASLFDTLFYVGGSWPHPLPWILGGIWAGVAMLVLIGVAVTSRK